MIGEGGVSERPPLADLIPRPRCETCRWWEPTLPGSNPTSGLCGHSIRPEGARLRAAGGRGVLTVKDFGCVQWEGKGE